MTVTLDPATGNPSFKPSPAATAPATPRRSASGRSSTARRTRVRRKSSTNSTSTTRPPAVHQQNGVRRPRHRLLDRRATATAASSSTAAPTPRRSLDDTVIYSNAVNSTAVISAPGRGPDRSGPRHVPSTTGYWTSRGSLVARLLQRPVRLGDDPAAQRLLLRRRLDPVELELSELRKGFAEPRHLALQPEQPENTVGNDGKPHSQIPYRIQEETDAQYIKFDYAIPLGRSTSTATSAGAGFTPRSTGEGVSTRQESYAATNGGTATTYVLSNSLAQL
jgi:iron complex outermembrane receptor protein